MLLSQRDSSAKLLLHPRRLFLPFPENHNVVEDGQMGPGRHHHQA
jgi:hypothetical protein